MFHRVYAADGSSTATLTNSSGTLLQSYVYYSNGNVFHRVYEADGSSTATLTNSSGTVSGGVTSFSYTYNAEGILTGYIEYESDGNIYSRTYTFDTNGNVTGSTATLTNSSGTVANGVTSISYAYNAQGVLTSYDYYYTNGNVFTRTYNADGTSYATLANSSNTILEYYEYDAKGNLTYGPSPNPPSGGWPPPGE